MSHSLLQHAVEHPQGFLEVSVTDFHSYGDGIRIVDVREPDEFNADLGHIPGSELVPLGTVEQVARSWDQDEPILLVCRSGGRSGRAAQYLRQAGFKDAINLRGGMMDYNHLKLPVDRA